MAIAADSARNSNHGKSRPARGRRRNIARADIALELPSFFVPVRPFSLFFLFRSNYFQLPSAGGAFKKVLLNRSFYLAEGFFFVLFRGRAGLC